MVSGCRCAFDHPSHGYTFVVERLNMNVDYGKHMMVWKIKDLYNGDAEHAAEQAFNAGISVVNVKFLDGTQPYNQRPIYDKTGKFKGYEDDVLLPWCNAFKMRNIKVYGWHYVYHGYPRIEAERAIERCQYLGLDAYVIDAEAEAKVVPDSAVDAFVEPLTDGIVVNGKEIPIYLSSYRYPKWHPQIRYTKYFSVCDGVMPQVYWEQSTKSGEQLIRSFNEYHSEFAWDTWFSSNDWFVPIASTYSRGSWVPTVAQVANFCEVARMLNLKAIEFYRWGTALDLIGVWEYISNLDFGGVPEQDTVPVDTFVVDYVHPWMKEKWGYNGPEPTK